MSNIKPGSMDGSNGESGSFKPGTFGMSTDGSVARTSQVQGQGLKHDNPSPREGSGSEGNIDGSDSEDVPSLAPPPSTVAAQEPVKEDPSLDITFQFDGKPKATTTVNAAMYIERYYSDGDKSREVALAYAILRAQMTSYWAFVQAYPNEDRLRAKCRVLGKEVQSWKGLEGEYMRVSDTVAGIMNAGDK